MSITHSYIHLGVDDADPDEVGPDEWNEPHVGGAEGGSANVEVGGTTPVSVGSAVLDLAADDTVRVELFGYIRNTTGGARTLWVGMGVGSTTFLEISGSATVANNTDTTVTFIGYFGVRSTSLAYFSGVATLNPVSAENTPATAVVRMGWDTTATNLTGSQTVHILSRGSASGAGLAFRVAGYSIQKIN